jgi:hypothetical protein
MSKLVVTRTKVKIDFTDEQLAKRKEVYYMMLTSLNTIRYCIAEIDVNTLRHEHKSMFKNMHAQSQYLLDNIFAKASRKEDIEILQDISFNNVAAATTVFGLMSKMPQEQIDWFTEECVKLSYAAYNRQNMQKNEKL